MDYIQEMQKVTLEALGPEPTPERLEAFAAFGELVEARTIDRTVQAHALLKIVSEWRDKKRFVRGSVLTVSELSAFVVMVMEITGWHNPVEPALRIVNDPNPEALP
jgi:hypothetical protein